MFDIGKHYEFEMHDQINDGFTYYHAEVLEVAGTLLQLRDHDAQDWVFDTCSTLFVRAREIEPPEAPEAFLERLAAAEEATPTVLTPDPNAGPLKRA